MTDEPIFGNADLVQSLRAALQNREHSIKTFPGLLRRTIETDAWRTFRTPLDELVNHERFAEFLNADPFEGLGISDDYARAIVAADKHALDALDWALQRPPGNPTGKNQYTDEHWCIDGCEECCGDDDCPCGTVHNVNSSSSARPVGNSESAALRRLRNQRPDLHTQVLNGELSAHAAAVQAGFRKRTVTIRTDNAESIAKTLRKQLGPTVLKELRTLLEDC